jgi:hypothetical protein
MSESIRRNWIPLAVTTALSVVGALLLLSSRAGALEQRVTALEQRQTAIDQRLDRILTVLQETREGIIRVQTKLDERPPAAR